MTLGTKPPTDSNGVPITLPPIVETDVDGRTVTDSNGKPKTMTVTSPPQPTDDTSSNPSNGEDPIRTDPGFCFCFDFVLFNFSFLFRKLFLALVAIRILV